MAKPAPPGPPFRSAADSGPGMGKDALRPLLRHACNEPVSVAFALGADGKALLLLHKRTPPRTLERQIRDEAPRSTTHRFGTATVDPDNPKLVRLTVNKAALGMARRLVLAFKGTGCSKVEISSEDGAAPEQAESDEPEEVKQGGAASGGTSDPGALPVATASDGKGVTALGGGGRTAGPAQAVTDDVAGLVRRLRAPDGAMPRAAVDAALGAQAAVKAGDLDTARRHAATLRDLADGSDPSTGTGAGANARAGIGTAAGTGPSASPPVGGATPNADAASAPDDPTRGARDKALAEGASGDGAPAGGASVNGTPDGATAVRAELSGLIAAIKPVRAADPVRGAELVRLATEAHGSLLAGDLAAAGASIGALRAAMRFGSSGKGKSPEDGNEGKPGATTGSGQGGGGLLTPASANNEDSPPLSPAAKFEQEERREEQAERERTEHGRPGHLSHEPTPTLRIEPATLGGYRAAQPDVEALATGSAASRAAVGPTRSPTAAGTPGTAANPGVVPGTGTGAQAGSAGPATGRVLGRDVRRVGSQAQGAFPTTPQAPNVVMYRADASGKITHYQVWGSDGLPLYRVDLVGKAHAGIPTPHVVEYGRNTAPDGKVFTSTQRFRGAATPDEIP